MSQLKGFVDIYQSSVCPFSRFSQFLNDVVGRVSTHHGLRLRQYISLSDHSFAAPPPLYLISMLYFRDTLFVHSLSPFVGSSSLASFLFYSTWIVSCRGAGWVGAASAAEAMSSLNCTSLTNFFTLTEKYPFPGHLIVRLIVKKETEKETEK